MTESFSVERGVRQGCPAAPVLFVLSLDPLIRKVATCPVIRGFPTPGTNEIKVTAYADDISIFVGNKTGSAIFLELFEQYSSLSGAYLNTDKSKAIHFGAIADDLPGGVQFMDAVRVLWVIFEEGSIPNRKWEDATSKTCDVINGTSEYKLSSAATAGVLKTQACAYAYYIAHVALLPRSFAQRFKTLTGAFIWEHKPTKVKTR